MKLLKQVIKAYNERVIKTPEGCWDWSGGTTTFGYARFKVAYKMYYGHRISYELHKGTIPEGFLVRHSCDNPKCTNPNHLVLGTHEDNNQDKIERNRQAYGESHGNAKIKEIDVKEIQELVAWKTLTDREISSLLNTSLHTVQSIKYGRTWKHLAT